MSETRRPAWLQSTIITIASLLLAFLVSAIVMVAADAEVASKWAYFFSRPGDALSASWDKIAATFHAMWVGSVGSWGALTNTTREATPLICAGLGVAVAFRAGLFNIGAQGQAMVGALFAAFLGFTVKGLPIFIHLPLVILAGVLAGAIWGGIVGLLKARSGAHEVILTIMMNYIAGSILAYFMLQPAFQAPGRADPISPVLEWSATMPRIAGSSLHLGFLLALIAAAASWWLLERTKFGINLKAVGLNPNAAATAGASVSNITMITMALSGALAGLAGVMMVTAPESLTGSPPQMTGTIIGTLGFDAITVALLGRSRPLGVVFAGLLFGALKASRRTMVTMAGTPDKLTDLIQALVVLFVAAPAFVAWLLPFLKERKPKKKMTPEGLVAGA
ncbi:simple sugar transport system permease protein [Tessaracoccus bendigoensis DSM 12906]|uniref:Simple sugar transport system permease protein n=1 Tax=Tessaracoccus bendigoensis DSM 12906 TaxID=1123357 RepID=A0A1M6I829_9ACTN|nr:ABC transporter permease [Tessaracoccus bendigoensis]SHJ30602.1 simple sugar transport system permease protein [Tessaracoccus bendigoensis DSM 12906]